MVIELARIGVVVPARRLGGADAVQVVANFDSTSVASKQARYYMHQHALLKSQSQA